MKKDHLVLSAKHCGRAVQIEVTDLDGFIHASEDSEVFVSFYEERRTCNGAEG